MDEGLTRFLICYNLYRIHGSLRRKLKIKTSFNAIEKLMVNKAEPWFEISPHEINLIFTDIT